MLAEERRSKIQDLLLQKSSATIAELSELFDISTMTIRRDLDELAARGVCQRIHGGALSLRTGENRSVAYPGFLAREQAQASEKTAIAAAAAALVQSGDIIAIDAGTTAAYLAHALRGRSGVTVISNSDNVLGQLYDAPGITCISPGGVLTVEETAPDRGEWLFAGPVAVAGLRGFRPRRAFISTSGLTLTDGIFNARLYQVEIKRTLIQIAAEVILITDATKFGRGNGMIVAPITAFHKVITDAAAPAAEVSALRALGIEVIVVEPAAQVPPLRRAPCMPLAPHGFATAGLAAATTPHEGAEALGF